MPTHVFFNLKKAKQERITNAALTEISHYRLEDASIKRIVEAAEIARGSFYQYFVDIDDLFLFILNMTKLNIQSEKRNEIQINPNVDFVEFIHKSFIEKIESIFTEFNNQIDNQILKMVMASDKAQKLFIENIGFASMISELRENFKQMNFHSKLDDYSMNIIFDMTFSLVEDTVYKLLKRKITKEQAIQEVDIKLHILTFGIYGKPYIVK